MHLSANSTRFFFSVKAALASVAEETNGVRGSSDEEVYLKGEGGEEGRSGKSPGGPSR